ncbi:MAG: type I-E CRISPR-associated endoribonuclease Cas2e [Bacillota bacterium]
MMVLILERVSVSLRGELTRWLLEPKAGVFVGRVSALVREKLWEKAIKGAEDGGCMLIYRTNNEQGFAIRIWGECRRRVEDFEGLQLIRIPKD